MLALTNQRRKRRRTKKKKICLSKSLKKKKETKICHLRLFQFLRKVYRRNQFRHPKWKRMKMMMITMLFSKWKMSNQKEIKICLDKLQTR